MQNSTRYLETQPPTTFKAMRYEYCNLSGTMSSQHRK